jgi:hypothetical protein
MISEQELHTQASSASPNNKDTSTQFSTGFSFRECAHGFSRRHAQTPQFWIGYTRFLRTTTGFTIFRVKPGYSGRWLPWLSQDSQIEWIRTPSRLTALVLFACTRVDTCHPGNYMRSIRTPSSHHLGNHVSFQRT